MKKQGIQMYLLLIVVLLHQTVCSTDFESSESELVVDFESNLDSLNLMYIRTLPATTTGGFMLGRDGFVFLAKSNANLTI